MSSGTTKSSDSFRERPIVPGTAHTRLGRPRDFPGTRHGVPTPRAADEGQGETARDLKKGLKAIERQTEKAGASLKKTLGSKVDFIDHPKDGLTSTPVESARDAKRTDLNSVFVSDGKLYEATRSHFQGKITNKHKLVVLTPVGDIRKIPVTSRSEVKAALRHREPEEYEAEPVLSRLVEDGALNGAALQKLEAIQVAAAQSAEPATA